MAIDETLECANCGGKGADNENVSCPSCLGRGFVPVKQRKTPRLTAVPSPGPVAPALSELVESPGQPVGTTMLLAGPGTRLVLSDAVPTGEVWLIDGLTGKTTKVRV